MTGLEKAKKKYWYDHNFDKSQNHWDAYVELSIFAEGFKVALELVREKLKCDCPDCLDDFNQFIEEELDATSEKRC